MEAIFKALNDKTRRQILRMLKEGDMTAGQIAEAFDMSKPSISNHLNLLKQAKLVLAVKKGQFVHYSLSTSVLEDLMSWVMDLKSTEDTTIPADKEDISSSADHSD